MRTPQMSIKDKKQPDEVKLLKRARKLDQDALTRIYQNYHDAIYRYVYHHLGNAQTAEDLTSDVFRHFLQALRNGGGPTRQLKAWLYRVAHNLIVDELRRRKHRNHQSLDETLGDTLRDDALGLDRLVGDAIAVERVRRALLTLTEEQRQIIVLKFLEGMSNAEVAEITGRTVGAVKSLQHRGLDALRAQLAAPAPRLTRLSGERAVAPSFAS
jgi:RNA polymerase sigma-70 factor (ECF subfamily)